MFNRTHHDETATALCVCIPGQRSPSAVSRRESSYTCSCLASDDVHELHLGFQSHSSQTPLPWLWKSESHTNKTLRSKIASNLPLRQDAINCSFGWLGFVLMCFAVPSYMPQIVCRSCSRNRYPLKYMKDRMAKVCDHCYNELKKRGEKKMCPNALEYPISLPVHIL